MPDPISWAFTWPYLLSALAAGYLLGSIPFGLALTRLAGRGDLRRLGSGNIGATNVLRTGSRGLALATLILDGGKGAAALLAGHALYGPDIAVTAAAGAFLGHLFPVWLAFRGGKGVATALGILLAGCWPVGALAGLIWLLVALLFRISSLAALAALLAAPLGAKALGWIGAPAPGCPILYHRMAEFAGLLAVMVWVRHAANIRRLIRGEEPRIGKTTGKA